MDEDGRQLSELWNSQPHFPRIEDWSGKFTQIDWIWQGKVGSEWEPILSGNYPAWGLLLLLRVLGV